MRHLPFVLGCRVEVYRNLRDNCLSIRSQGIVLGHAQTVRLERVNFVVQPGGRARVLREKQKNVHAFARGVLVEASVEVSEGLDQYPRVSYNPYRAGHFSRSDGSAIWQAEAVLVTVSGVYLIERVTNERA